MLVAPAVHRLLAPNPSPMTGPGTNTYLIGQDEIAVVDPGPALPEHVEAILAAAAMVGGRITASLVTHAHQDHLPAAALLRDRTGAPILAHRDVSGVDRPLANGEEIIVGSLLLTAHETPGHASEHLCFWIESERLLFTGDLIAGAGTVVLADAHGSLAGYLASLQRMAALGPSTILPGHGPVVRDGLAKIREYQAHRAQRDRQILEALRHGPATIDRLVRRLYAGTPPSLYPMAARNVGAHLERLAENGQVTTENGHWRLFPIAPSK